MFDGTQREQGYNEDLKYGCCFWPRKTARKLKYEISSSHDHLSPLRPELNRCIIDAEFGPSGNIHQQKNLRKGKNEGDMPTVAEADMGIDQG